MLLIKIQSIYNWLINLDNRALTAAVQIPFTLLYVHDYTRANNILAICRCP